MGIKIKTVSYWIMNHSLPSHMNHESLSQGGTDKITFLSFGESVSCQFHFADNTVFWAKSGAFF